ncbi:MAG: helix-turn-helix domain-containing protein [Luteolibacter sp.]
MAKASSSSSILDDPLLERLKRSDHYRKFKEAFQSATGLPLRIVRPDSEGWCMEEDPTNRSPFCEVLNVCESACHACLELNHRLMSEAKLKGPSTCHCFAGLCATAVPLTAGSKTIGYLKTGQVFTAQKSEEDFETVLAKIGKKTVDPALEVKLREAYFQTRFVQPARYNSMISLLQLFAGYLSRLAETLQTMQEGSDDSPATRACRYIKEHFREDLELGTIAQAVSVSPAYLCRSFRKKTGLTISAYLGRCRIEAAKEELLNPEHRITSIAFDVGFQTLSQFNRTFTKLCAVSPSEWRRSQLAAVAPTGSPDTPASDAPSQLD